MILQTNTPDQNRRQNPSKLREFQDRVRKIKDKIFSPLSMVLDAFHIQPVVLSVIGFIFGLAGALLLLYSTDLALICILLYFFFDNADGALARFNKVPTLLGWWQDYILDRILRIVFTIVAIILTEGFERQIFVLTIFVYIIINGVSVVTKDRYHINLDYIFYALLLVNIQLALILAVIELGPGLMYCIYKTIIVKKISSYQKN